MKKIKFNQIFNYVLLIALVVATFYSIVSCSPENECSTCIGQFINVNNGEVIHEETDCERVPPADGFVFVKCVDNPDY